MADLISLLQLVYTVFFAWFLLLIVIRILIDTNNRRIFLQRMSKILVFTYVWILAYSLSLIVHEADNSTKMKNKCFMDERMGPKYI